MLRSRTSSHHFANANVSCRFLSRRKHKKYMSVSLNVRAYSSKESKEFQKHYSAVKFCIENELSFPKETSLFFKGKVRGEDLEDINPDVILKHISNGVEINMPVAYSGGMAVIRVKEIPFGCDSIIITMS